MFATSLVILNLLFKFSFAFLRLQCDRLTVGRYDPIVNPGKLSGHVHNVVGSNAFSLASTYNDLIKSKDTSCQIKEDHSAYWTPLIYVKADNGSYVALPNGGMAVYYLPRSQPGEKIVPFPVGLKMIGGSMFNTVPVHRKVQFICMRKNYVGDYQSDSLPTTPCEFGLRAQITFPNCWDGMNLDSADHSSHVAYGADNDNSPCPPNYPKRIPTLLYETFYDTNKVSWAWKDIGKPTYVLSTGDLQGYGYHGDFLMGWEPPAIKHLVDNCQDSSFHCNGLTYRTGDDMKQSAAAFKPLASEVDTGVLETVPGMMSSMSLIKSGKPMAMNSTTRTNHKHSQKLKKHYKLMNRRKNKLKNRKKNKLKKRNKNKSSKTKPKMAMLM